MMYEQRDYIALEWVADEISETLKLAYEMLDAYQLNRSDITKLRFCLTYIHQVQGILQMVEFYGPSLLAKDMEILTESLIERNINERFRHDAFYALQRAITKLPNYLEQIKSSHQSQPLLLVKLLNDVRAVRSAALVSEGLLFLPKEVDYGTPNFDALELKGDALKEATQKLNKMYHLALHNLFKGQEIAKNLNYLAKVCARFAKICHAQPSASLWHVAIALLEGLLNRSIDICPAIKMLLRELGDTIKNGVEKGEAVLCQEPDPDLIKNLLFYVSLSRASSKFIKETREKYALNHALTPLYYSDVHEEQQLVKEVTTKAIYQHLNELDKLLEQQEFNKRELKQISYSMAKLYESFAVVDAPKSYKRIKDAYLLLEKSLVTQSDLSAKDFNELRNAVSLTEQDVRASVDGESTDYASYSLFNDSEEAQQQLNRAVASVYRESRLNLEKCKQLIVDFVSSQWNHQTLLDIPPMFREIRGSLNMIPSPKAAAIMRSCELYVSDTLLAKRFIPDWQSLDVLADAITSIDYYLERVINDSESQALDILDVAEDSVAKLGYPINELDLYESTAVETTNDGTTGHVAEALIDEPSNINDSVDLQINLDEPQEISFDLDGARESASPDDSEDLDKSESELVAEYDEDYDPEIVEIFIEESTEVLEEINQFLPRWEINADDHDARSTVRRAFHTLKGSGRMVGAIHVGELAWSIEHMLNKVIDGTYRITPDRFKLIAAATALMPELVESFKNRSAYDLTESVKIINKAELLTANQNIEEESSVDRNDNELIDIFVAEANTHIVTIDEFVESSTLQPQNIALSDDLQRSLHTLKGSARMAEVDTLGDIVTPVESMVKQLRMSNLYADEKVIGILAQLAVYMKQGLVQLKQDQPVSLDDTEAFFNNINIFKEHFEQVDVSSDDESLTVSREDFVEYLASGLDSLSVIEDLIKQWLKEGLHGSQQNQLGEIFSQFIQHSESVFQNQLAEFGACLKAYLRKAINWEYPDQAFFKLAIQGIEHLIDMMDQLAGQQQPSYDNDLYLELTEFDFEALMPQQETAEELFVEQVAVESQETVQVVNDQESHVDDELLDIFYEEADELMDELDGTMNAWGDELHEDAHRQQVLRILHTLKGGARLAGLMQIGDLTHDIETNIERLSSSNITSALYNDLLTHQDSLVELIHHYRSGGETAKPSIEPFDISSTASLLDVSIDSVDELVDQPELTTDADIEEQDEPVEEPAMVSDTSDPIEVNEPVIAESLEFPDIDKQVLARISADSQDAEIIQIFIEESGFQLDNFDRIVNDLEFDEVNEQAASTLLRELHTIKGNARLSGFSSMGDYVHDMESMIETRLADATPVSKAYKDYLHRWHDKMHSAVNEIASNLMYMGQEEEPITEQLEDSAAELLVDDIVETEITSVFLEEADELYLDLDEALLSLSSDPDSIVSRDKLLRVLHTFKGGARSASLMGIGEFCHDFETYIEEQSLPISKDVAKQLFKRQDQLQNALHELKNQLSDQLSAESVQGTDEDTPDHKSAKEEQLTEPMVAPVININEAKQVKRKISLPKNSSNTLPALTAKAEQGGPQEVVKVTADLLENLVNLAGETSISRSRVEEQISELVFSLDEMQLTADRLQEQVRRLDMETEQQILYRQEQVEIEGNDEFDPLEMDRYSSLQQLSRSLLESSSDLIDIKNTLGNKARDMETLLIQQSRINTELQEGLMRSRMVPFARLSPRLRRIVRQVSSEVKKDVHLHLGNIEGELDRSVLERMVAPLEHMLRNAIDHGIEIPDIRQQLGKAPAGKVSIDVFREGGEIVLILSDDGAGIDTKKVRAKAVQRGLMKVEADLSDREILQFILESGFTTAEQVTQISGRGVGMDVVNSEIKQLGGSMEIISELGKGTTFKVRLPFTVSVNRALMVSVGGDRYAIPLTSIEGIVRVSPYELEVFYQPNAPLFEYAGQSYMMRYMGALLNRGAKPNIDGITEPLPVILVRGADHSIAVQVDHLLGSREIVVKPLGPQFAAVPSLSGATVLGDGSVVVIIDLPGMIRADAIHMHQDVIIDQSVDDDYAKLNPLVMVVDDSVTVRKVTSRFLERQGYEVLLAKDGLDAVTQLNEIDRLPDVMLLDIEMPRMDGFEVARRVRHTERLQDIPIIMITSRTGEKHYEQAISIGVNRYMGKPYQEKALLESIVELTGVNTQS